MPLSIRVHFLAGYSGREWPPSPARLFKSLVSSARAGWAVAYRAHFDEALRKLENESQRHSPMIIAPEAILRPPRQRRFVPNNSKKWPPERTLNPKKGFDLEPEQILRWDVAPPAVVWYCWPAADSTLAGPIRELARHIPSLGKGEDFAVIDAVNESPPTGLTTWHATSHGLTGLQLEVPESGCLDVCDANFRRSASTAALPVTGTRNVRYVREVPAETATPTSVLALWSGGHRRSWDARLLRQVVGPIRRMLDEIRGEIVDVLASSTTERVRLAKLAQRILLGHDEHGDPVQEPHFAVLPIPSILGPHPDGRIRRVALVGFGCETDPERRAIFDLANVLLQERELVDNGVGTGVTLRNESEPQWFRQIQNRSRWWTSITPVVQVAQELTSAEWRSLREARRNATAMTQELVRLERRLRERRLELVVRAVNQAIAPHAARLLNAEILPSGSIGGVHLATHYRVAGYLAATPRFHVRVEFDREVTGPLAIGRGRHVGFGLFWPERDDA